MRVLRPFRSRDFLFLWLATQVSLLGDGIYFVAIAWEVYDLSNDPAALSLVGVAWTIPHVCTLLLGGAVSDRMERRRVMVAANIVSGLAIGTIAALVLGGEDQLWQIWALVAVYGASVAFFIPASSAIVPEVVDKELLLEANSLNRFVRPLTLRLLGPTIGGVLVAAVGAGTAFAVDAASFAIASVLLLFIRKRTRERPAAESSTSLLTEVADGFRFVRSQTWLWVSLLAAGLWLFITVGPIEVLIPYLVKNRIGSSAAGLGLVFAAGGAGAFVAAIGLAAYGRMPRRPLVFVYLAWAGSTFGVAMLALGVEVWQAMLASVFLYGLSAGGGIVWQTVLQKRVPGEMLGRVSSLDWFASAGLVPVSFALTGPVAAAFGASRTLFSAGVVGAALMLLCLLVPALRATEPEPHVETDAVAARQSAPAV